MHGLAPQHGYTSMPDGQIVPQHYWDPAHGWVTMSPAQSSSQLPIAAHGGGAGNAPPVVAPDTQPHMRWGRLLAIICAIGIATVALAHASSSPHPRSVGGGGASGKSWNDDSRSSTATDPIAAGHSQAPNSSAVPASPSPAGTSDGDAPPSSAPSPTSSPSPSATPSRIVRPRAHVPVSPNRAVNATSHRGVRTTVAKPRRARGGGGAPITAGRVRGAGTPQAGLPYTGAPAWIAAVLGVVLLGIGIAVQLRATEIGMTASQYRRGPLLRPLRLLAGVPLVYLRCVRWIGRYSAHELRTQFHQFVEVITRTPERDFSARHRVES